MISKRRRDLPHWEVEGATYFLTFRLADAMPSGVLAEFKCRTEAWLRHHGCAHPREVLRLTPSEQREFRQVISRDEEQWLDSGQGSCVLRHSKHRKPLIETLHHFDGMRYVLDEYVIMPNHVHAILQPMHGWALAKIAATWKQLLHADQCITPAEWLFVAAGVIRSHYPECCETGAVPTLYCGESQQGKIDRGRVSARMWRWDCDLTRRSGLPADAKSLRSLADCATFAFPRRRAHSPPPSILDPSRPL